MSKGNDIGSVCCEEPMQNEHFTPDTWNGAEMVSPEQEGLMTDEHDGDHKVESHNEPSWRGNAQSKEHFAQRGCRTSFDALTLSNDSFFP